jgi:hypothetical protein
MFPSYLLVVVSVVVLFLVVFPLSDRCLSLLSRSLETLLVALGFRTLVPLVVVAVSWVLCLLAWCL